MTGGIAVSLIVTIVILLFYNDNTVQRSGSAPAEPDSLNKIEVEISSVDAVSEVSKEIMSEVHEAGPIQKDLLVSARDFVHEFQSNILAANNGDPDAMFRVGSALKICKRWEFHPGEGFIQRVELEGAFDEQGISELENLLNSCAPLYQIVEGQSLKELRLAWNSLAAENGNVFARLEMIRDDPSPIGQHEMEQMVYEALDLSIGDPILKESAFRSVIYYHTDHLNQHNLDQNRSENMYDIFPRGLSREAWGYLDCAADFRCDIAVYREMFITARMSYQLELVSEMASKLEKYIENQEWDKLGLSVVVE